MSKKFYLVTVENQDGGKIQYIIIARNRKEIFRWINYSKDSRTKGLMGYSSREIKPIDIRGYNNE
jgi:hypothetical protein